MATGTPRSADARGARSGEKAKVSPARNIIGLVLLIVCAAAAAVEILATRGYNAAVAHLEKIIPQDSTDPTAKKVPRADVERLIGKAPSGELKKLGGGEEEALYVWQGLRRHAVKAYYESQAPENIIRFETQ